MPILGVVGFSVLAVAVLAELVMIRQLTASVKELTEKLHALKPDRTKPGGKPDMGGPELGASAPRIPVETVDGRMLEIGGSPGVTTLLLFVSLSCQSCKNVAPQLKLYNRPESLRIIGVCLGEYGADEQTARLYIQGFEECNIPLVISKTVVKELSIKAYPSYMVLDGEGKVVEKDLLVGLPLLEKFGLHQKSPERNASVQ